MSQQALEAFKAKLAQDQTLRKEMTSTLSAGGTKASASLADVLAFAKSKGFDISEAEMKKSAELSDEELDRVAGGASSDYYLKLGSVSGETSTLEHKDEIELLSWSWSAFR